MLIYQVYFIDSGNREVAIIYVEAESFEDAIAKAKDEFTAFDCLADEMDNIETIKIIIEK